MSEIGYTILLCFGGTISAALWTFVIGLGGAPGAFITALVMRHAGATYIPIWGLFLTIAGQLYVSLTFTAFVLQTTITVLENSVGIGKWIIGLVTFFVAIAPALIALKNSSRAKTKNVQHFATTFTAPLTAVGFFVFVFVPNLLQTGWGWIPHF